MKSVLMSIQPKWVDLIASGKKTIEVRKTRPKKETPFNVYIYETKGKQVEKLDGCEIAYYGRGKVIGEFTCDKIEDYTYSRWGYCDSVSEKSLAQTCLTANELCDYGKQKTLYAWHISDLKIYDKPRELSEFKKPTDCKSLIAKSGLCDTWCLRANFCSKKPKRITRPPQSWCYVEDLENVSR